MRWEKVFSGIFLSSSTLRRDSFCIEAFIIRVGLEGTGRWLATLGNTCLEVAGHLLGLF